MAYTAEQKKIASLIVRIGRKRKATRKEIVSALETGLVESSLRNLAGGDGTSVGWRQETSGSYGNVNRRDVRGGINRYYNETAQAGRGAGKTAGQLAQSVQRSAFPARYDQRRGEALGLYRSLAKGSKTPKKAAAPARTIGAPTMKKGKNTKTPSSPNRFAQQAALATEVRYGGEKRQLGRALQDAEQNLQVRSALEDSAAKGTIATLEESKPKLVKGYSDAQFQGMQNYQDVQKVLEKLGVGADVFKAITAREEGQRQNRVGEAVNAALAETERRKAQAQSGATYGKRAAIQQRDTSVGQIGQRLADIEAESGAFNAATYGTALEKQRDRNTKVKTANIAARSKEADRKARLYSARLTQAGLNQRQADKIAADWKKEVLKQDSQNARSSASNAAKGGKSKPPTQGELKKRAQILQVRDIYKKEIARATPLSKIAKKARDAGIPNEMVVAGADLATLGYVKPASRQALKNVLGIRSPSDWRKKPAGFKGPKKPQWPKGF